MGRFTLIERNPLGTSLFAKAPEVSYTVFYINDENRYTEIYPRFNLTSDATALLKDSYQNASPEVRQFVLIGYLNAARDVHDFATRYASIKKVRKELIEAHGKTANMHDAFRSFGEKLLPLDLEGLMVEVYKVKSANNPTDFPSTALKIEDPSQRRPRPN